MIGICDVDFGNLFDMSSLSVEVLTQIQLRDDQNALDWKNAKQFLQNNSRQEQGQAAAATDRYRTKTSKVLLFPSVKEEEQMNIASGIDIT